MKNTGQLDPTRNPTQPATRLTRLKMTRFDQWSDWPDPTRPARFAMSSAFTYWLVSRCIMAPCRLPTTTATPRYDECQFQDLNAFILYFRVFSKFDLHLEIAVSQ